MEVKKKTTKKCRAWGWDCNTRSDGPALIELLVVIDVIVNPAGKYLPASGNPVPKLLKLT